MPSSSSSFDSTASSSGEPAAELDLRGERCPFTFVRARLKLEEMAIGERLCILVDHEPATRNIPRSATEWGQTVEDVSPRDPNHWQIVVRKLVP